MILVVTWLEYLPHNPTEVECYDVPNLYDFLLWDRKGDILEK